MKELSIKEARNLQAGGISVAAFAAIASCISFAIGIVDGIVRVIRCN